MQRCIMGTAAVAVLSLACVSMRAAEVSSDRTSVGKPPDPRYTGSVLIQLRVADLDRSVRFYTQTLGFDLIHRDDALRWAKVRPPGGRAVIGLGMASNVAGSGTASINLGVHDVAHARAVLERRGVSFAGATQVVEGVVALADFTDPDGHRIRLAQSLDPDVD